MNEPHDDFVSDDARYAAVATRDARADGRFFYAVVTTGVFCRPSCAARLALRKNVAFYRDADAAEHAGFRACKRCRPHDASMHDRTIAIVAAARTRIAEAETAPSLAELADAAGMSRFHFQRLFVAACGMSPKRYAIAVRAQRVADRLAAGASVTGAFYDAGYASSSRFYADAPSFGIAPKALRAGAAGIVMHVAVTPTSLGHMLVAATERGVCAVLFGDDIAMLQADLRRRFVAATIHPTPVGAPAAFAAWIAALVAYVARPRGACDIPLDVLGTAFQQRVWRSLRTIEAGTTATYAQVAERIGAPRAARAVARACAENPVAVAIPCHRVVRADASPSGYRWGLARKRELLDREGAG